QPPELVASRWQEQARTVVLPRYLRFLLAARPKITHCLALLKQHPPLPGPLAGNVRIVLEEMPRIAEAADPAEAVARIRAVAGVGRQGTKAWADPDVYAQIRDALEAFRKELDA